MNHTLVILFGALGSDLPKGNGSFGRQSSLLFSDVLLIVGLGLALLVVLAALVYGWSKLKRKSRRRVSSGQKVFRGSHHSSDEPEPAGLDLDDEAEDDEEPEEEAEGEGSHSDKRKYRYRVRRRTHRSRNPTLSQTGGLPPVKAPEPTKPG